MERDRRGLLTTVQELISRYRIVLTPLVLALLIDVGLLVFNSIVAIRLEQSASLINLAGSQRMLSQRLTKSLALTQLPQVSDADATAHLQEFVAVAHQFNQTLTAFMVGGLTRDVGGNEVKVEAITQADAQATLRQAQSLWQPIIADIVRMETTPPQADQLRALLQRLTDTNMQLLLLMNDLTSQLEADAANDTRAIRYFQTFIVISIFLLFALALLRLKYSEDYFTALMESASDIVLSINMETKQITFINKAVELALGYPDHYYLLRPYDRLFTRRACRDLSGIMARLKGGESLPLQRLEAEVIKSTGDVLVVDCVLKVAFNSQGQAAELLIDIRDITERKRYEQKLKSMAHSDALTGLTNRALFFDFARQAMARSERQSTSLAVLFIDLDGFKAVNDNCGHEVGDRLLQLLAKSLSRCFRQSDVVARLGGDEFAVLIEGVAEPAVLASLCEKVIEQLSQPLTIDHHHCQVGASIGVALYPEDGQEIEALLTRADEAMYRAKGSGGSAFGFARQN